LSVLEFLLTLKIPERWDDLGDIIELDSSRHFTSENTRNN